LRIGISNYVSTRDIIIEEHLKGAEKEKYRMIEEKHSKEIDSLRSKYEEEINTIERKHKQDIEIYYGKLLEENRELKISMNERDDKLRHEYDEKEKEVRQDYMKMVEKMSEMKENTNLKLKTPKEIGKLGENNIKEYLEERYNNAIIEMVGEKDGVADIWITFVEDNSRILIEVKLKGENTKKDIEKFENDVIKNYKKRNIDSGLYISLRSSNIPKKGDMCIEKLEGGVGVIYITDVIENPIKIEMMIKILRSMSKLKENENIEEKELIEKLNKSCDGICMTLNNIKNINSNIEGVYSSIKLLTDNINNMKEDVIKQYSYILNYLDEGGIRYQGEMKESTENWEDKMIKEIIKYNKSNKGKMKAKDLKEILKIDQKIITESGGMKVLIKKANDKMIKEAVS